MREKFKALIENKAVFMSLLVLLVAVTAFGLGRASVIEESVKTTQPAAVRLIKSPEPTIETKNDGGLEVVASKNGTKYHLPTCPGAKQISEQNKITFRSVAEAEAAGYSKAANCEGF